MRGRCGRNRGRGGEGIKVKEREGGEFGEGELKQLVLFRGLRMVPTSWQKAYLSKSKGP